MKDATNDGIDNLSGRELDAAVAREGMGVDVGGIASAWRPDGPWGLCPPGNGEERPVHVRQCYCGTMHDDSDFHRLMYGFERLGGHLPCCLDVVPCYSAEVESAWQAMEAAVNKITETVTVSTHTL